MFRRLFSLVIVAVFLVINLAILPQSVEAVTKVKGYTKKNGTYVQPYYKSDKNSSKFDNYSTKGNINLYTGKKGTVNPYKSSIKK